MTYNFRRPKGKDEGFVTVGREIGVGPLRPLRPVAFSFFRIYMTVDPKGLFTGTV